MGIQTATRKLAVPHFPLVTLSSPLGEFRFKYRSFGFGHDPVLYGVLSMLSSYTIMIDDFCNGRRNVPMSVLIDHRNAAQHALLSVPPREGKYECCRLSALIYSLLVTFPLPYLVAPFQQLVAKLKLALTGWDESDDLIIWVLTVGGIGAIGLREREWFVKQFQAATQKMGLNSWYQCRVLVAKTGLWLGATNDGDGRELWNESQNIENGDL